MGTTIVRGRIDWNFSGPELWLFPGTIEARRRREDIASPLEVVLISAIAFHAQEDLPHPGSQASSGADFSELSNIPEDDVITEQESSISSKEDFDEGATLTALEAQVLGSPTPPMSIPTLSVVPKHLLDQSKPFALNLQREANITRKSKRFRWTSENLMQETEVDTSTSEFIFALTFSSGGSVVLVDSREMKASITSELYLSLGLPCAAEDSHENAPASPVLVGWTGKRLTLDLLRDSRDDDVIVALSGISADATLVAPFDLTTSQLHKPIPVPFNSVRMHLCTAEAHTLRHNSLCAIDLRLSKARIAASTSLIFQVIETCKLLEGRIRTLRQMVVKKREDARRPLVTEKSLLTEVDESTPREDMEQLRRSMVVSRALYNSKYNLGDDQSYSAEDPAQLMENFNEFLNVTNRTKSMGAFYYNFIVGRARTSILFHIDFFLDEFECAGVERNVTAVRLLLRPIILHAFVPFFGISQSTFTANLRLFCWNPFTGKQDEVLVPVSIKLSGKRDFERPNSYEFPYFDVNLRISPIALTLSAEPLHNIMRVFENVKSQLLGRPLGDKIVVVNETGLPLGVTLKGVPGFAGNRFGRKHWPDEQFRGEESRRTLNRAGTVAKRRMGSIRMDLNADPVFPLDDESMQRTDGWQRQRSQLKTRLMSGMTRDEVLGDLRLPQGVASTILGSGRVEDGECFREDTHTELHFSVLTAQRRGIYKVPVAQLARQRSKTREDSDAGQPVKGKTGPTTLEPDAGLPNRNRDVSFADLSPSSAPTPAELSPRAENSPETSIPVQDVASEGELSTGKARQGRVVGGDWKIDVAPSSLEEKILQSRYAESEYSTLMITERGQPRDLERQAEQVTEKSGELEEAKKFSKQDTLDEENLTVENQIHSPEQLRGLWTDLTRVGEKHFWSLSRIISEDPELNAYVTNNPEVRRNTDQHIHQHTHASCFGEHFACTPSTNARLQSVSTEEIAKIALYKANKEKPYRSEVLMNSSALLLSTTRHINTIIEDLLEECPFLWRNQTAALSSASFQDRFFRPALGWSNLGVLHTDVDGARAYPIPRSGLHIVAEPQLLDGEQHQKALVVTSCVVIENVTALPLRIKWKRKTGRIQSLAHK